jgi:hypothetical protein
VCYDEEKQKGRMAMKIKDGFLLRQVAGQNVVLPVGEGLDLNMMITLNDTGKFLWEQLSRDTDESALVAALLEEYDVDRETAERAVSRFLETLTGHGFLA